MLELYWDLNSDGSIPQSSGTRLDISNLSSIEELGRCGDAFLVAKTFEWCLILAMDQAALLEQKLATQSIIHTPNCP